MYIIAVIHFLLKAKNQGKQEVSIGASLEPTLKATTPLSVFVCLTCYKHFCVLQLFYN